MNRVLFAPEEFKQHCCLANATGVVPVSRLTQAFPWKRRLERALKDNAKSSCVWSSAGGEIVVLTSP